MDSRQKKILMGGLALFLISFLPSYCSKTYQQKEQTKIAVSRLVASSPVGVARLNSISDKDGMLRTKEYYMAHGNELLAKLKECRDNPQSTQGFQNCDNANKAKDIIKQ